MKYILKLENPKTHKIETYSTDIEDTRQNFEGREIGMSADEWYKQMYDFWEKSAGFKVISFEPESPPADDNAPSKYDSWYNTKYKVYHSFKDSIPDVFYSEKTAKEYARKLYQEGKRPVWITECVAIEIFENDTDVKTAFARWDDE